jgi:hypothetical protein
MTTSRPPFWLLDSSSELAAVDAALRRRFPRTFLRVSDAIESEDPYDIVYPGNPGEYVDVVREFLVLIADVAGDITSLSRDAITGRLTQSFECCFAESPDAESVGRIADALRSNPPVDPADTVSDGA